MDINRVITVIWNLKEGSPTNNTGSNGYNSAYSKFIYDVTSTTNCKIRFSVDSQATLQYMGGRNFTAVKFIRLTDT